MRPLPAAAIERQLRCWARVRVRHLERRFNLTLDFNCGLTWTREQPSWGRRSGRSMSYLRGDVAQRCWRKLSEPPWPSRPRLTASAHAR